MTIEVAVLISGVSVAFGIYFGMATKKRNDTDDVKKDATAMTTIIVKLENISDGITEIKKDMNNVKSDVAADRERIIRVEESSKQAHKRLDGIEKHLNFVPIRIGESE